MAEILDILHAIVSLLVKAALLALDSPGGFASGA